MGNRTTSGVRGVMRTLVWWIRSCFCAHVWEREEIDAETLDDFGDSDRTGTRVSATCTACGWHRSYWKEW